MTDPFLKKFTELLNNKITKIKKKSIDPTELKEILLKRFRELIADQQERISHIASPKTAYDLVAALNTPDSPAYKKFMNELINDIELQTIDERLIEQFLVTKYEATEKEKDELLKAMIAHAVHEVQKNMQEYALMVSAAELKRIQSLPAEKLQQRLIARADVIENLTAEKQKIEAELSTIEKIDEQQTLDWKKYIDFQKIACIEKIKSGELVLISPEGNQIDAATSKKIIERALEGSPANKVVSILSQSLQSAMESENTDEHALVAAPVPPLMPPATVMANKHFVIQEINFAGVNAEETLPKDEEVSNVRVLAAVLENKKKGTFAAMQKIINKSIETTKTPQEMFQEALNNNAKKIINEQLLQNKESELNKELAQQKIDAEQYKKLTNEEFVRIKRQPTITKKPRK